MGPRPGFKRFERKNGTRSSFQEISTQPRLPLVEPFWQLFANSSHILLTFRTFSVNLENAQTQNGVLGGPVEVDGSEDRVHLQPV